MSSPQKHDANTEPRADLRHASNPAYLAEQYSDAERLNIRREAHRLYSENSEPWEEWLLARIAPVAGERLLDIGCGPGTYHALLSKAGVAIVGLDASFGMLVEARPESKSVEQPADLVQAGAEQLPIAAESVDCVMANHMLYHVADAGAALREMRRVLRLGGRLIIVVNSADAGMRLEQLHRDAARALGYTTLGGVNAAFNGSHGFRIARLFPNVKSFEYRAAFRFPTTEAALRYYASGFIDTIAARPVDNRHRALLLEEVGRRMDAIVEAEGCLRIPKGVTCFLATKEAG